MEEIETGPEDIESGATEGESPDASSTGPDGGDAAKTAAPKQEQDTTPFHEHPRFKELVEQKNEALKRYQDMESRYKTIEQQISSLKESSQPKGPTEFDQLILDLKKIDPRLASALEAQAKSAKSSEALQARLDAFEKQSQESARSQQVQTAVAKINQMHESNKASPEIKQFINDKLDLMYMQGKLSLQNLDQVYKEQYDTIKKYEDSLTRSIRESYVKDKKKDSSVPTSQPKGAPAKAATKKPGFSKDPETARAQVVSRYLKQAAANRDADAV